MEEYIKILLEQVRFKKAHKAIGDEIRAHIEDQAEENISEGMDKETAEKRAVEDMGDPVEAGIALDKVHRPQVAWGVIVVAIIVGILGIIIKFFLSKIPSSSYSVRALYILGKFMIGVDDIGYYIYDVVCGITVMLIMYLVDYTTVARYSKIIAAILLFSYTINKKIDSLEASGYVIPNVLYSFFSRSETLVLLLVPLFAGIIYKYRGQKYKGLIKSLIWIMAIGLVTIGEYQQFRAAVIVICLLAELTIAIHKEWIKVPKTITIVSIWSLFAIIPMFVIRFMYNITFSADSQNKAKEIMSGVKAFGSGTVSYVGGNLAVSTSSLVSSGVFSQFTNRESYEITKIAAVLGGVVTVVVIAAVVALIVLGFVATARTKNQLGAVMGSGCMMWLIINAIFNIGVGTGLLPSFYHTSFFPFISEHKVIESYAFLGIILSVYKYKDAYPQHIDIKFRSKLRKFESGNT
ncbi:permease prefix domain 1-containing protein [Butyrivibrio sp. M55]|uniref:permease prefix domain 1-containing protein n=1 Tax=Butyrivibrio sp. M55 TaxID=1855323 RepID=UPI0008E835CC|nr:permease prefix domain 1-containing protein [Butyrivibrio sp. M55]SFU42694.1 cell division protein FtsW, lipid II flippase [Butyrivibrio sp. M55]